MGQEQGWVMQTLHSKLRNLGCTDTAAKDTKGLKSGVS